MANTKAKVFLGLTLAFAAIAGVGAIKKNLPLTAGGLTGYAGAAIGLAKSSRKYAEFVNERAM
jgi:hypothetical protein